MFKFIKQWEINNVYLTLHLNSMFKCSTFNIYSFPIVITTKRHPHLQVTNTHWSYFCYHWLFLSRLEFSGNAIMQYILCMSGFVLSACFWSSSILFHVSVLCFNCSVVLHYMNILYLFCFGLFPGLGYYAIITKLLSSFVYKSFCEHILIPFG